jgi:hypothetical protein
MGESSTLLSYKRWRLPTCCNATNRTWQIFAVAIQVLCVFTAAVGFANNVLPMVLASVVFSCICGSSQVRRGSHRTPIT